MLYENTVSAKVISLNDRVLIISSLRPKISPLV